MEFIETYYLWTGKCHSDRWYRQSAAEPAEHIDVYRWKTDPWYLGRNFPCFRNSIFSISSKIIPAFPSTSPSSSVHLKSHAANRLIMSVVSTALKIIFLFRSFRKEFQTVHLKDPVRYQYWKHRCRCCSFTAFGEIPLLLNHQKHISNSRTVPENLDVLTTKANFHPVWRILM